MPGQNASLLDGRVEAACGLLAELGACGLPWASFSRSRAFRRVLIFLPLRPCSCTLVEPCFRRTVEGNFPALASWPIIEQFQ